MNHALRNRLIFASLAASLLCPMLACGAGTLEEVLRERRPDITRWQVQPLAGKNAPSVGVTEVGRIGPRTAVRFADGHVRWYAIAGFRDVLVSAHAIEGGAPISAIEVRSESRDVLSLGCEPVSELRAEARWRARRRLAPGEVLCESTIEPAPEVERNRAVTLSARSGGVEVSRVVFAAHDARAGELVRLRDAQGVNLTGIVTGTGRARISGEGK